MAIFSVTEELIRKRSEHNEGEISTLEELSLHQENIDKIECIQNWCRDLKILLLQSNLISKLENLGKLKKLEYLNLALNNIEVIENLEGCESLQKLDLTLNFIGDLTSVKKLKSNCMLESLYLMGNPCVDYTGYRDFVITVLPQIKYLDSTEVTKSERIKASQTYPHIQQSIIMEQSFYKEKRLQQKNRAKEKTEQHNSVEDYDSNEHNLDAEKASKFWSQMSENTPEARIEIAEYTIKAKRDNKQADNKKEKHEIRLFNKEGRPLNVNETKVPFTLTEDDETNSLILEVAVYRYLDTALIDVDVQPLYVKVLIKGKVLQITLSEEVHIDLSSAKRSQTTGHLVITMPKVNGEIKSKKPLLLPVLDKKENQTLVGISRREYLEIGSGINKLDFSKIIENNSNRKYVTNLHSTEEFDVDPEMPPLE